MSADPFLETAMSGALRSDPEPSLDRLRTRGEALLRKISAEYYLAHSGRKNSAELQPIFDEHSDILNDASLAYTLALFNNAADGSEERRSARYLLDWQVESLVARALAPLDERIIEWEGIASAPLDDGRRLPYQRLMVDISNASDRRERQLLERARARLVTAELAPMRTERIFREVDLVCELGIASGYLPAFSLMSGLDLPGLVQQCREFLRDTDAMWTQVLAEYLRSSLSLKLHEANRADALFLFRAMEFDGAFPADKLLASVRRQIEEMGLDFTAQGRIILDVEERDGKRSRAFCAPTRVPDEVYLVIRPHGGRNDYRTFLHELGHAMHFSHASRSAPFEYRWLGDNSVTEGYAMLFDHLVQNAGWMERYSDLPAASFGAYMRRSGFDELHYVRRYCAKLIFEAEVYDSRRDAVALSESFVETMRAGTGFRYDPCDAFVDFDPRFYSARYLRAWQLQALFADILRELFDEDWYRNPRAGPWIISELMSHGQRELAHEIGERVSGRQLSFAPLRNRIEALLA